MAEYAERVSKIPEHLRIRVLFEDEDIVIVDKPSGLRSVPGNANPPPTGTERSRKRPYSDVSKSAEVGTTTDATSPAGHSMERRTGQEAWLLAIQSFRGGRDQAGGADDDDETCSISCLQRLADIPNIAMHAPRKFKLFHRYIVRNQKRLFPDGIKPTDVNQGCKEGGKDRQQKSDETSSNPDKLLEFVTKEMFSLLQKRQKPFLNLPEPTKYEDSAYGQLILMGHGTDESIESNDSTNLKVVHRLDCETSGVMVFAKNFEAGAKLSQDWRERDGVTKEYVALVQQWPPYNDEKIEEGTIDVPLAPSEERIKWKVVSSDDKNAKPSISRWKVQKEEQVRQPPSDDSKESQVACSVVLQLFPITGRTHQLRIHCAHVGSGIVGDTLYGSDRTETLLDIANKDKKLHLHARKLEFRHPRTREICSYSCTPDWL